MKALALLILGAAALLAAAMAAGGPWRDAQQAAGTDGTVVTTLAIDMDPKDGTGSFVNNDHTVGTIDKCITVEAGASFDMDVVLDAIPPGRDLDAFQYFIGFDAANLTFTAQNHNSGSPPPNGVTVISRVPGLSCSGLLACIDSSEAVPDPPSTDGFGEVAVHHVFVIDSTGSATVGSAGDPYGNAGGVLGRYTISVSSAAPARIYGIGLNNSIIFTTAVNDNAATPIWDLPGDETDNDNDGAVDEDLMLDATTVYGRVAVGVPCSEEPLTTPTPTPTPGASPTPAGSPSPTPAPGQTDLAAGWNNVCHIGASRPIEEAMAEIGPDVTAVYRLTAGQGFDRWFPGRPDASTITTLGPYEPLFILMASSASWTQEGQASPPAAQSLSEGWNSVCYTGQTKDTSSAATGIEGEFAVLYALDSQQGWQRFVPARPEVSNLSQLVNLRPVFILMTQPGGGQWTFDP
jgi:hypothetical protein